jgi:hypothetical protein
VIEASCGIYFELGLPALFVLPADVFGLVFGGREHLDSLLILEDRPRIRQNFQYFILDSHQLIRIRLRLNHKLLPLRLKLRLLMPDNHGQQLSRKSILSDTEIEKSYFGGQLGQVVGVAEAGAHVEMEIWAVGDYLLA